MSDTDYQNGDVVYYDGEKYHVTEPYNGTNILLTHDESDRLLRANPDHLQYPENLGVTYVDGVGDGRAEKLNTQSIATVGHLVDRGVEGVTAAGIDEGHAEEIVDTAKELVK